MMMYTITFLYNEECMMYEWMDGMNAAGSILDHLVKTELFL